MLMPAQLEIQSEVVKDTARIGLSGELDMATVPQMTEQVQALLSGAICHLVIDLSQLMFIDSSGLNLLIALNERATYEGWQLSLTRPPERIFSVFTITRADENLPFLDDPCSQ